MYETTLEVVNPEVLDAYEQLFANIPEMILEVTQESADEYAAIVEEALGQEPGAVAYPIQWKSERQRKAFFASDGFGKGIPYQRIGTLVQAWEVTVVPGSDEFPAAIEVRNFDPAVQFVQGIWQQPFHRNTGWVYAPDKLNQIQARFRNSMARRIGIKFRQQTGGE